MEQTGDSQMRVQELNLEREKLRQRQLEIQQNQQRFIGQTTECNENTNHINQTAINNQAITTTGIDPFLSENHSRQESADSGLGSNYSNYSDELNDHLNYVTEVDLGLLKFY